MSLVATSSPTLENFFCDEKQRLFEAAKRMLKSGYSIGVVDDKKTPVGKWKELQNRQATEGEIIQLLSKPTAKGICLFTGYNGVEAIDIDCKYDLTGNLYKEFCERVEAQAPGLIGRLTHATTISSGHHKIYRCETIEKNQKLANRYSSKEEVEASKQETKSLIETRGLGGLIVCAPSKGYSFLTAFDPPIITIEERDILLSAARSFNQIYKEETNKPVRQGSYDVFEITPWDDYNEQAPVVDLLHSHGWKTDHQIGNKTRLTRPDKPSGVSAEWDEDKRRLYVWTSSSQFNNEQGYTASSIHKILQCNGDASQNCKELERAGYGVRKAKDEEPTILAFWYLVYVNDKKQIKLDRTKFYNFLSEEFGIYLYYYTSSDYMLIRKHEKTVEQITSEKIKRLIKNYIFSLPEKFDDGTTPCALFEFISKGSSSYFSDDSLEWGNNIEIEFLRDTEDAAYFPFLNGVVEVSKNRTRLLPYAEVNGYVWKSNIIQHTIKLDIFPDTTSTDIARFLYCAILGEEDTRKHTQEQKEKIHYAWALIGYLLHRYKDPAKPYAVVLAEETESEENGGGTGKGIFGQAISKVVNCAIIDGKNFERSGQFSYQRIGLDTAIISIQDLTRKFNIEANYNDITEGLTIQKKHKDEFYIPYADSPKFLMSTNYTIRRTAESDKRRLKVLEFATFFSSRYTPEQHFGKRLFTWNEQEWNDFYCTMFNMVFHYLKDGIKEPTSSDALKFKHLRTNFSEEFVEWVKDFLKPENCQKEQVFSKIYKDFLSCHSLDEKAYTVSKFRKAVSETAKLFGYTYEKRRETTGERNTYVRFTTRT
jgi:hypothetical protein